MEFSQSEMVDEGSFLLKKYFLEANYVYFAINCHKSNEIEKRK